MIPKVFLRSVEMFNGLDDTELGEIQHCCEEVAFDGETQIFKDHDPADFLYTVADGGVSLVFDLPGTQSSKKNKIAGLESGSTFGWSGILPGASYTLTAYCTGDSCKVLKIKASELTDLCERNHTIGYKVMKNLTQLIGKRFVTFQNEIARQMGQNHIDGW